MHPYSIKEGLRTKAIIGIFIISLIVSYFLNIYVLVQFEIVHKVAFIAELSALTVFEIIMIIFDRLAWKFFAYISVFDIPNLDGKWDGYYISNKTYDKQMIPIECTIKQTWTKIGVYFRNDTVTNSKSLMAAMELEANPVLRYEYINFPREQNLAIHTGTCKLEYEEDKNELAGEYYNDGHNGHSGTIVLKRRS
jgi:hypothetical protein